MGGSDVQLEFMWPRFEDGAPVQFGDVFRDFGRDVVVDEVSICSDGSFSVRGGGLRCRYREGTRLERADVDDSPEKILEDICEEAGIEDLAVEEYTRRIREYAFRQVERTTGLLSFDGMRP